jgi:hypothetical protein
VLADVRIQSDRRPDNGVSDRNRTAGVSRGQAQTRSTSSTSRTAGIRRHEPQAIDRPVGESPVREGADRIAGHPGSRKQRDDVSGFEDGLTRRRHAVLTLPIDGDHQEVALYEPSGFGVVESLPDDRGCLVDFQLDDVCVLADVGDPGDRLFGR